MPVLVQMGSLEADSPFVGCRSPGAASLNLEGSLLQEGVAEPLHPEETVLLAGNRDIGGSHVLTSSLLQRTPKNPPKCELKFLADKSPLINRRLVFRKDNCIQYPKPVVSDQKAKKSTLSSVSKVRKTIQKKDTLPKFSNLSRVQNCLKSAFMTNGQENICIKRKLFFGSEGSRAVMPKPILYTANKPGSQDEQDFSSSWSDGSRNLLDCSGGIGCNAQRTSSPMMEIVLDDVGCNARCKSSPKPSFSSVDGNGQSNMVDSLSLSTMHEGTACHDDFGKEDSSNEAPFCQVSI